MQFDILDQLNLRLSGSWSDRSRQFNSHSNNFSGAAPNTPTLNVLNNRFFEDKFTNLLFSSKLTFVVSPTSLLDVSLNIFNSELDREDSYFGNDWESWYDSTAVSNHTGGRVTYRNAFNPDYDYLFNGLFFARDGDPYPTYRKQEQEYVGGSFNYTTQAGQHHELKIGGTLTKYKLRRFALTVSSASQQLLGGNANSIRDISPDSYVSAGAVNNYGYDIYGDDADSDVFNSSGFQTAQAPYEPLFGAFYIQDKVEYRDLVINAGLRLDYFDSDGRVLVNPENPDRLVGQDILDEATAWEDKDADILVQPRVAFSFPVSEETKFYANYGRFVQLPELETMFAGVHAYNRQYVAAGFSFQDPVGYALNPIRTTSYEIGFSQQVGSVAAFDLSGFYRNVRGQVQVDKVFPADGSGLSPYNILVNGDFATTKGLEFSLRLRRTNRLQATFNYTLSSAQGTNSTRTSDVAVLEIGNASERPSVVNPLDFNQTHRGAMIFDYRFDEGDGGAILQNLGLNGILSFNSGHAYTTTRSLVGQANSYDAGVDYMNDTRSRRALEGIGASNTPWNFQFDLSIDKSLDLFAGLDLKLYARIENLFNTKNVINVFNNTGTATDDGYIQPIDSRADEFRQAFIDTYGEDYITTYTAVNIDNGQSYWDQLGLQLFSQPRQVFFGLRLNY